MFKTACVFLGRQLAIIAYSEGQILMSLSQKIGSGGPQMEARKFREGIDSIMLVEL